MGLGKPVDNPAFKYGHFRYKNWQQIQVTPIRFTTDIVLFTVTSGSTALRGTDFSGEKTIQLQQDTQPFLPEKGSEF